MNVYQKNAFLNRKIRLGSAKARKKGIIDISETLRIEKAYPEMLYSPNVFVRLGLFVLSLIAASCITGLLALTSVNSEAGFRIAMSVADVSLLGCLELSIRKKPFYKAGVDDGLLYAAITILYGLIVFENDHIGYLAAGLVLLFICLLASLRYVDALMALVAYGSLLWILYFTAISWGSIGQALLPFLMMLISLVVRNLVTRLRRLEITLPWHFTFDVLDVATLVTFYLAGNYYVVREANALLSGVSGPVPMGWLFWTLTITVPLIYIGWGLRKKDPLPLWTGLALVAATVLTFRYYYHVLPAELAMIIAGIILIGIAWWAIRYLHTPRYGLTSQPGDADPPAIIESLVIAETFHMQQASPESGFHFGGGSGGGGGAGGDY